MILRRISLCMASKEPTWRALSLLLWALIVGSSCVSTSARSEANDYISLIAGKSATVRTCPSSGIGEPACSKLLATLTSAEPPVPLTPTLTISKSDDRRLLAYGASCPTAGSDVRGVAYDPYETEFDGERAIPAGPFEIFDLSAIYPSWKGKSVVKAQGYGPKNFGNPTPPFGWALFYIVQNTHPCEIARLAAAYPGGFDQPSPVRYANDLVQVNGGVLLIQLSEVDAGAGIYHGTVFLVANKPSMQAMQKNPNRTLLMTFTAK